MSSRSSTARGAQRRSRPRDDVHCGLGPEALRRVDLLTSPARDGDVIGYIRAMTTDPLGARKAGPGQPPTPWTLAGGPDPAYDAAARERNRAWLTDPRLAERFQQIHPDSEPVYERMIRALDLVWDCPDDDSVNVVGYRCAGCGATREISFLAARCREAP